MFGLFNKKTVSVKVAKVQPINGKDYVADRDTVRIVFVTANELVTRDLAGVFPKREVA